MAPSSLSSPPLTLATTVQLLEPTLTMVCCPCYLNQRRSDMFLLSNSGQLYPAILVGTHGMQACLFLSPVDLELRRSGLSEHPLRWH
ncbi:hypothetical protein DFH09DRAFT_1209410 [Mycena vulgaris]|nr:hypothetical protein DFH09DRAFT_1209410 [Mycena vulgaris]